jgi:sigma-E factor negative regulatory protein RseC
MITESGRVVAVEADCLWVETIRRSTCNSCSAQKACGHGLMNKAMPGRQHHLRVPLNGQPASDFNVDDEVEISIPEQVLVTGALVVYMLPLLLMLAGGLITAQFVAGDVAAVIGSAAGFGIGLVLVRYHARLSAERKQYQPTVLNKNNQSVAVIDTSDYSPVA